MISVAIVTSQFTTIVACEQLPAKWKRAPPTATVQASFSKRRRQDTQVLHPDLTQQLHAWLATKDPLGPDDLLFPKVTQTLARHSDIRLTLGVYTHAELADQKVAIGALPGPPAAKTG